MSPEGVSDEDLQGLIKSLNTLQWTCWKNFSDPVAARALQRLRVPMAELMGYVVSSILQEMKSNPADPQVQAMGVRMLRALIQDSEALKRIVLVGGGVEVLVQGVRHHPTDENLLSATLEAIDELHGLASLLQFLDHLRESPPGVRAGIWAFAASAKAKWSEVQHLPPNDVVRIVLAAVDAHKDDYRVLSKGVELISDLMLEMPEMRAAFAALGGWPWLLQVMENNGDHGRIQLHGCKLLSALSKGGAWAEQHSKRAIQVLERCLIRHDSDECVLYWAFWAVQQLNGARALVAPMRSGSFKSASAMVAALRSLHGVALGQSEGAGAEDMPAVVDAVVHAMGMYSERYDVIYEATGVLGRVAAFVLGSSCTASVRQGLFPSVQLAVNTLLHLMRVRMADAYSVQAACEALVEVVEACDEHSPVRSSIRESLLSQDPSGGSGGGGGAGGAGGEGARNLLAEITAAHVSNDNLQLTVMWLNGIVLGARTVLQQMVQHSASHAVQLPAIKTLSRLYGDRIEVDCPDLECLPDALRAVTAAMANFPENIILQQHACYALCTIAEHSGETRCWPGDELFTHSVIAAAGALRLVQGRCDGRRDPSSYNALYLRKEATRCIVSMCAARPSLSKWLRDQGLQEVLADALKSTADSVWDGRRDAEAEETLRLELLALSYVLGPPTAILESLRRWGAVKPAVARAAADAVVDLARGAMSRGGQQQQQPDPSTDPEIAAVIAPVQALNAAGCGAELMNAMQAHAADEDLQGRLHLAVGFMGGHAVPAA
mmetsp:Transcript_133663/g.333572  ORF Transcript_133663/g.333572 Transcript_133663/m.333572 type:complete len:776 (-) Transcript_133663:222-2549(-)